LKDALNRYQVSVNPRYQPLALPVPLTVGGTGAVVFLPLDTAPSAVVDQQG